MAVQLTVAVVLAINGYVEPDEAVRQLPQDGAWAKFQLMEKYSGNQEETVTETIVGLVGQKTIENQKFRWVEVKMKFDDGSDRWHVFKWLVAEEKLKLGGSAAFESQRAYRKSGERDATEIDIDHYSGRLSLLLPPSAGLKSTGNTETVKWQRGELNCDIAEVRKREVVNGSKRESAYQLRLNKEVPFGVAGATMRLRFPGGAGSTADVQYWLTDMGTGAKSAIPLD